jgi:predicted amidohydrolase
MTPFRIALANLAVPTHRDESVAAAVAAIVEAGQRDVGLVCFPECFVPGYRVSRHPQPIDSAFLDRAWAQLETTAAQAGVAVVLGTERLVEGARRLTALVIDRDGRRLGFQDKVQLDPSEEGVYSAGSERHVFRTGALTFGVAICHEGWRYPETVRWPARHGAQVVFHPHFDEDPAGPYRSQFGDPTNTFHEKAMLCRAAENSCYFASVNCAGAGVTTTSAIAKPDGTLLAWQPYGQSGLLVADLDLDLATGFLAKRFKPQS